MKWPVANTVKSKKEPYKESQHPAPRPTFRILTAAESVSRSNEHRTLRPFLQGLRTCIKSPTGETHGWGGDASMLPVRYAEEQ